MFWSDLRHGSFCGGSTSLTVVSLPNHLSLFSSPGLQAGVLSAIRAPAVLTAFSLSASALAASLAKATFEKPAEAGSANFSTPHPALKGWARENPAVPE